MSSLLSNRYVLMGAILVLWGLWGFFPKVAAPHVSPRSSMVYQAIGSLLVSLYALWSIGFKPDVHWQSIAALLVAGAAAALGGLLFITLLRTESATVAVSVTALYPIVTIALAILFLGETVTLRQGIGILLSLVALVLVAA